MANTLEIRLLLFLSTCVYSAVAEVTLSPPVLRSCWELYTAGYRAPEFSEGLYTIDPDGLRNGEDPFQVTCDLSTGDTIIGHDRESSRPVPTGNADPGSYSVPVTYDYGTEDQILALVDVSESCSQTMTFDCTGVRIWNEERKALTWWVSRDGLVRDNWGASYATRGCSCSETSVCDEGQARCNCDVGDATPREDTGTITDINLLPIKELRIGGVESSDQAASYHLGKLRCTGSVFTYRSCADIDDDTNFWALPSYYMIDPDGGGGGDPFLVYCLVNGNTQVPHNLCDLGSRTLGDEAGIPDCDVTSYAGERFEECDSAACAEVEIEYGYGLDVTTAQLVELIEATEDCEQVVQITCFNSGFSDPANNRYWLGRFSPTRRYNFGGDTGTSGCDGDCNCDMQNDVERTDTGTIKDEATLPIVSVFNGDTGDIGEYAFVNVGPLQCGNNVAIDECTEGIHTCDANAECEDTDEGYDCTCNNGYWGSGYECHPILFYLPCDNLTVIENAEFVEFNVWRTGNALFQTSSVQVDFVNVDAEHGTDFREMNINVEFPAASSAQANVQYVPVTVNIINDEIVEANETFRISLSNAVNGMIVTDWYDTAMVNIINDDTSFEIELDKYDVNEDDGYADITIVRRGYLDRTGSVVLNSTEDTAVEVLDFAGEGKRKISFTNWEARKTVRIGLLNDRVPEETEQFFVGIEEPVNGMIVPNAVSCIRVLDEDTTLCPESNHYTVLEDDPSVDIRLLRGGDTSENGFVRATAYIDGITSLRIPLDQEYVTINAGDPSITIRIDLTDDLIRETTENITFYIIEAGEDHICPERWVVISISDDDSSFALSDTHYTAHEGQDSTVYIEVERDGYTQDTGSCKLVTSQVTDLAESAVAGLDYIHRDMTVSFYAGDEKKSVPITILNDNFLEAYEAFVVTLSDCTNGALTQPSSAFVGIIDDDFVEEVPDLPVFTLAAESYDVYESEGLATVTVNKQGGGDASVRIATYPLESSASVTQDFEPKNELLEFTGGETSRTVSIPIVNDFTPEDTKTIVVKISNPINAYLGDIDTRRTVINVHDLDSIVYFRTSEISVSEDREVAQLEVVREGYLEQPQTVGVRLLYIRLPGGANTDDFDEEPTNLFFGIGQTSALAEIPIHDDLEVEDTEIFEVRLVVDTSLPGTLTAVDPLVAIVNILDNDDGGPGGDSSLALIIGGSVAGGLVFIGVAGLALAVCFKSLAASKAPQRGPLPPKYIEQPPQPLIDFQPQRQYGYPPALNSGYNNGYPYPR